MVIMKKRQSVGNYWDLRLLLNVIMNFQLKLFQQAGGRPVLKTCSPYLIRVVNNKMGGLYTDTFVS